MQDHVLHHNKAPEAQGGQGMHPKSEIASGGSAINLGAKSGCAINVGPPCPVLVHSRATGAYLAQKDSALGEYFAFFSLPSKHMPKVFN